MRRLITGLAVALLGISSPAHATGESTFYGECDVSTHALDGERFDGVAFATVALYSNSHGNVVNATVTCEIRVNGVTQASVSRWGSGVVPVAGQVSVVLNDTDDVRLCTVVDYTSDDTPTQELCEGPSQMQFPPQEWLDLLNALFEWADHTLATGEVTLPPVFGPGGPPEPPTGGGYDTGDAGFLTLASPDRDLASTCAFARTGETVTVVGATAGGTTIRCRLADAVTGAVLYDATTVGSLRDTVAATANPITVCTEGSSQWETVGLECRPGEPLDRVLS